MAWLQPTIILSDYEIILNILIVYQLNIKCIFIYIDKIHLHCSSNYLSHPT
jgi:hypothetical protein